MSDLTYTPERIKEARDRAAMAAMVDVDSFLLALDDIERLREQLTHASNIRAELSREVEAQIILNARKPLEADVESLRKIIREVIGYCSGSRVAHIGEFKAYIPQIDVEAVKRWQEAVGGGAK